MREGAIVYDTKSSGGHGACARRQCFIRCGTRALKLITMLARSVVACVSCARLCVAPSYFNKTDTVSCA